MSPLLFHEKKIGTFMITCRRRRSTAVIFSAAVSPHIVELLRDGSIVHGNESTIMSAGPFPNVPGVKWKHDTRFEVSLPLGRVWTNPLLFIPKSK
jgi:hypothetical protein